MPGNEEGEGTVGTSDLVIGSLLGHICSLFVGKPTYCSYLPTK